MQDSSKTPEKESRTPDELFHRTYSYSDMIGAFYAGCDYRHSLILEVVNKYGAKSQPDFREYMRRTFMPHDQDLTPEAIAANPLNSI